GKSDAPSRAVIGEHYLSGRSAWGNGSYPYNQYNLATPPDMTRLFAIQVEGNQGTGKDYRIYEQASTQFALLLNNAVAAGGWGIEFFHQTGKDWENHYSNWDAVDRNAYYEHLDNIVNKVQSGDVWQDTVGNVSRYIYSRDAATIAVDAITDTTIALRVDDMLDDGLYSVPLTVNTLIPETWSNRLRVTHNGELIGHTVVVDPSSGSTYARYNVIADGAAVDLLFDQVPPGWGSGDYNLNGTVDASDYTLWRDTLGQTVEVGSGADSNRNGLIDQADYDVWKARFGAQAPSGMGASSSTAVPEPSAMLLAAMAVLLVAANKPRRQP
ncbi:MAG: PEP-CTERM sorting domain-containing protein, partial [Planctomycetes bacterium]|nr:PEP-CTERM sorting domain-containing protein [Planctomycetota bacterium]